MDRLGRSISSEEDEYEPIWKSITGGSDVIAEELNNLWKQHYNVYVYQELPYPPDTNDKKGFNS